MASSSVFFALVIFISMFLFYSASAALVFPLTHSFSRTQFNSTHHLLKSTTVRSASRLHHHRHPHRQVSLPLTPGSDYTLSFSLGSQTISLYMDTGSDVVWLPCHPLIVFSVKGSIILPLSLTLVLSTSPPPSLSRANHVLVPPFTLRYRPPTSALSRNAHLKILKFLIASRIRVPLFTMLMVMEVSSRSFTAMNYQYPCRLHR